jgi:hypothetical protein
MRAAAARTEHPEPGQYIDDVLIVASAIFDGGDPNRMRYVLLTLNASPPHYRVQIVARTTQGTAISEEYTAEWWDDYGHIANAVASYVQRGGNASVPVEDRQPRINHGKIVGTVMCVSGDIAMYADGCVDYPGRGIVEGPHKNAELPTQGIAAQDTSGDTAG